MKRDRDRNGKSKLAPVKRSPARTDCACYSDCLFEVAKVNGPDLKCRANCKRFVLDTTPVNAIASTEPRVGTQGCGEGNRRRGQGL